MSARDIAREVVRFYCQHSPIARGKSRLRRVLGRFIDPASETFPARVRLGRHRQTIHLFTHEWITDHVYYGQFERPLLYLLACALRPGMTFLDVGAHVGLYTLLAADRVGVRGRVVSFEASARTFDVLSANVRLNGHRQVECHRLALADCAGTASLRLADPRLRGSMTLGPLAAPFAVEEVRTGTLDTFVLDHAIARVDAMKMDVEGAELLVLRGASSLFRSSGRPGLLQIELDDNLTSRLGYATDDVVGFLRDAGYVLFELRGARLFELAPSAQRCTDAIALQPLSPIARGILARVPVVRGAGPKR